MNNEKFSLEKMYELWNNENGTKIEIGPDREGLCFIELRQRNEDNDVIDTISLTNEEVPLIIKALTDILNDNNSQRTP